MEFVRKILIFTSFHVFLHSFSQYDIKMLQVIFFEQLNEINPQIHIRKLEELTA